MDVLPFRCAILTVSDTRTLQDDPSGDYLQHAVQLSAHELHRRAITRDDIYQIRAIVSGWIAQDDVQVVLITGGTGITGRDVTVEAIEVLLDKEVPGFGETFRNLSFAEIGAAALPSRAMLGVANGTYIAALPGSTKAVRLAWEGLLEAMLAPTEKSCNLHRLYRRLQENRGLQ